MLYKNTGQIREVDSNINVNPTTAEDEYIRHTKITFSAFETRHRLTQERDAILTLKDGFFNSFIHSFTSDIYIAPLQEKQLRGSPSSRTAKMNSLESKY